MTDVFNSLVMRDVQPESARASKNATVALRFFNSSTYRSIREVTGSKAILRTFSPSTTLLIVFRSSVKSETSVADPPYGDIRLHSLPVLLKPLEIGRASCRERV